MGDPAVEDVGRTDPRVDGLDAGLDLGDHAAADDAVGDQQAGTGGRKPRHQTRRFGDVEEHAGDVGEVDQLLGGERLGDGDGGRVGVDVERLPGEVGADGGDDRHESRAQEGVDDRPVYSDDVAHVPERNVVAGGP